MAVGTYPHAPMIPPPGNIQQLQQQTMQDGNHNDYGLNVMSGPEAEGIMEVAAAAVTAGGSGGFFFQCTSSCCTCL